MKLLKIAAAIAVSAGLLIFLLWSVDLHELAAQLRRTHLSWVALSAALGLTGLWVRARRWRYLFPPGPEPPGLVPGMMIGYMANNVLPLRAGEVIRVYVVARRWPRGFWPTLATLVVERVLDSLAIVLVLGVLVLLIPVPTIFRWGAITLLVIDLVAVSLLAWLAAAPDVAPRLARRALTRWPGKADRLARVLQRFVAGLDGIRSSSHRTPLVVWTALVWIVPALAAWVAFWAMDLDLPFLAAWTVLAFVGVGISVPSAPGYVGVFHYAAVLALAVFDVARPAALGYAIVFHASQVIPITAIGWLFLLREQLSLAEARRPPAPDPGA
ncbi:MAG TPA: lysylphosphatidylglycerol synthase transmembrane domain-containing protein [Methylomirabilota bacterium]|nr:lysylphosphatidylglycerol synthase transmembrane domain-containing protein [Methylomirabilota bacterium]